VHLIVLALVCFFVGGYLKHRNEHLPDVHPKVAMIVPCKGQQENLQDNLEAISTQDYPDYRVLFIIDSKDDAAYPTLKKITEKTKNAHIVLTTKLEGCSGKIAALLTGIDHARDAEVFVFADADIHPHHEWLAFLVAPLSKKRIGAVTGYRWYFPTDWTSSVISTWNMATISGLFNPVSTFAWGGSTAITQTLFEQVHLASQWKKGYSDDLILTREVKKAGYQIEFSPLCLVDSPPEKELKKFLRWGTTQFTWVRWYNPVGWSISFVGLIGFTGLPFLGLLFVGIGWTLPGVIMLGLVLTEMLYGGIGIMVLRRLMRYPRSRTQHAYRYVLLMPLAFLLYTYNILASSIKKHILWGGRIYEKKDTR